MQFRDLGAQYSVLKTQIDEGIAKVIESSRFILGPQVAELENELAEFVGTRHCIACANGTDALILTLMAWGVGEGDAVFVPDFTFIASASCAMICGATPVPVDIDPRTFNISPEALERSILKTIEEGKIKPSVIISVDLFGQPADYPSIKAIAAKYGLKLLEDGAQGFGGAIGGQRACSFGDAATTSFFPAKPLGCYGDGGAIFTNDDELDVELRSIRVQGSSPEDKYDNRSVGLNSRLDTLQAAILLVKFKAFKEYEIEAVNCIADKYTDQLKEIVITPFVPGNYLSSWAQYTILLDNKQNRDGLQQYLKENGIPSMIYYPKGLHAQTVLKNRCLSDDVFPNAVTASQTCLSLPMHPYICDEDINRVCKSVKAYLHEIGAKGNAG